ncbi:MAG: tRNA pseudouridine(55) synthase TruB [Alphaproteobacteria bacterium]|nr:MAG: tRNA pseudouridine(55) synthase TruB [Alphaproteobacteria bacterium]
MARRRKGRKIDGWVILDKPSGLSSAAAVARVRRALEAQKAGHAGTLDPLATGVLPIALGEATKTVPFIMDASKEYEFTLAWGEARDTDDAEGAVTAHSDVIPDAAAIDAALGAFAGSIAQVPPAYSALKVEGMRAYALARAGKAPALAARTVTIERLERLDHDPAARRTRFQVRCGKGTYIRSLARDLALALGSVGHLAALRRTRVGPFSIARAISLEMLEELGHGARAEAKVLPVMTALDDIPALAVTEAEAARLKQGQSLRLPTATEGRLCILCGDRPVAIAEARHGRVRPLRVFNL